MRNSTKYWIDSTTCRPRGYLRTLTHGDNPVSRLDVNHMMYDRGQKAMKSLGLGMDKDGDLREKEVHYRGDNRAEKPRRAKSWGVNSD